MQSQIIDLMEATVAVCGMAIALSASGVMCVLCWHLVMSSFKADRPRRDRWRSQADTCYVDDTTPSQESLMAILAGFQPLVDALTALPAKIEADKVAAVAAAEAAHTKDVTDTLAALAPAVNAVSPLAAPAA